MLKKPSNSEGGMKIEQHGPFFYAVGLGVCAKGDTADAAASTWQRYIAHRAGQDKGTA